MKVEGASSLRLTAAHCGSGLCCCNAAHCGAALLASFIVYGPCWLPRRGSSAVSLRSCAPFFLLEMLLVFHAIRHGVCMEAVGPETMKPPTARGNCRFQIGEFPGVFSRWVSAQPQRLRYHAWRVLATLHTQDLFGEDEGSSDDSVR